MTIENKVVVITGAGSGMGRATALHLGALGAKVVLGARREARIAEVAKDIIQSGGQAVYRPTDVTVHEQVLGLVDLACSQFGRLDVMVNNAGISPLSRFDALQVDAWDAMIDVNLRGVLHGIAAALPVFGRQQSGHFINLVSTAGLRIVPTMGVYAATKNAVRTISEALRQESGPNIRVTEVSPGMVQSELLHTVSDLALRQSLQAQSEASGMSAEAIAHAIGYAIDQPDDVEVGSLVIRPTSQS
ncbi:MULTISPECIES: SDR family oxidoreductase [Xanthomonas]|uniref:SDR family oxidoreductase n=1 Tax=Xanthomonas TaxID=338 RepID=UPI0003B046CB|nr:MULTISPECIES: SDR family oxidoreductase [Xanthomonas]ATS64948.1 SDR family oxidoreductase [Xanthomonas citri pv. phaseoli var. fuscans]ATS66719.1 SDR family oxidoreductase [Xanthomonas citri pv. phaseoli var. fuscans]ATS73735.1 SDR family oxidoreductase [Xanthomonas citri pv. phaseoli var. fuscans]ATS76572.1 SDR family oxidoreductase [Xanthomonas citri pv. phaseoli var. fuscans]ATS78997.1 SDR family oxidoreductase [Xanthomonas citri pv. phaseoli var. fuscans]